MQAKGAGAPLAELSLVGLPLASLPLASLPVASLPVASLPVASLPRFVADAGSPCEILAPFRHRSYSIENPVLNGRQAFHAHSDHQ